MVNVMLELRGKSFESGEPVKARLKSAVLLNPDVSPFTFQLGNVGASLLYPNPHGGSKRSSKKKKNASSKSKNNSNTQIMIAKGGKQQNDGNGDGSRRDASNDIAGRRQRSRKGGLPEQGSQSKGTRVSKQAPPTLGEDHFPALPSDDLMNKNKVEVEKLPEQSLEDHGMKTRRSSDSASTATTTSSSSSSKNVSSGLHSIGGYAAALLKPAQPGKVAATHEPMPANRTSTKTGKKVESNSKEKYGGPSHEISVENRAEKLNMTEKASDEAVLAQPPCWGSGRSFADVLRNDATLGLA
jgi:hypothetical protein